MQTLAERLATLGSDQERLASFAIEYITEQVEAKNGKEVFGEVTVQLIFKGKLQQVEVTDHAAYRPNQL